MGATKRNARSGVEDRWHRSPARGEDPPYPADADELKGSWCMDGKHGTPATLVCTARHGAGLRWLARWVDHDGVERTKSFPRKADAQKHIDGVVTALGTGTYADPQRSAVTFGVVAEAWLSGKAKARAPKTVAGYRGLLDVVIYGQGNWKDEKLRDITRERLQTWISWLSDSPDARKHKKNGDENAGLSPARVIQTHQVMHQVFAQAIRDKYLAVNPADYIELPKRDTREQIALNHDEVRKLAASCDDIGDMVTFLSYTGLRFGECIALRVGDVDMVKRTVKVTKSRTFVRGQGVLEGPTKGRTNRLVPLLTTELVEIVGRLVDGRSADGFLFPGPGGECMTIGWFTVRLNRAKRKLGPDFAAVTPHTLRHTAGSLALDVPGTNIATVSELLGHKQVTTTANVYSHALSDSMEKLAKGMNAEAKKASKKG